MKVRHSVNKKRQIVGLDWEELFMIRGGGVFEGSCPLAAVLMGFLFRAVCK